jgi:hypothetical protein
VYLSESTSELDALPPPHELVEQLEPVVVGLESSPHELVEQLGLVVVGLESSQREPVGQLEDSAGLENC